MATNASMSRSQRAITYLKRARWIRYFLLLEVFWFGGGWLVAQMGSYEQRLISQEVDPHLSLGGLMGAMGLVFGVLMICFLLLSLAMRARRRMGPSADY